ncbi:MAG: 30S ribosomal protein S4 [Candidatus Micrarchaeota archaeon]
MGDPRRLRNKFDRPKKLWEKDRIKHDKGLKAEYGLKSMNELFAVTEHLKKYRREARRMLALTHEARGKDEQKILAKLARMGVMKPGSRIEDILALDVRVFLERRLQTIVHRKGLARTTRQARQLITHGFISIDGRKNNTPGYMVTADEDASIMYSKPIDISVPTEEDVAAESAPKAEGAPAAAKPAEAPEEDAPEEAAAKPAEAAMPEEAPKGA